MPRFSVLLPTRGRLDLLRQAIETVRRQAYADWEIVVSDNASTEDVASYIDGLRDPRIRCLVQPTPIPVTDNWNRTVEAARGEWLIMLGDDDGLMPGSLARYSELVDAHRPDAIYADAWVLTYPGALPGQPDGSVSPYGVPGLFRDRDGPYLLDPPVARRLVRRAAGFEMAYTFNMQHSVLSRALVDRLSIGGAFYHSPYPDFYATNAVFWVADRLLVVPERLVVIGLSPKSFGAYYFNRREAAGVAFLANVPGPADVGPLAGVVLPGSPDRTSWLLAMEALRRNITGDGLRVDVDRYRRLVLLSAFGGGRGAVTDPNEKAQLTARLRPLERLGLVPAIRLASAVLRLVPTGLRAGIRGRVHRLLVRSPVLRAGSAAHFRDMLDVFERSGELTAS